MDQPMQINDDRGLFRGGLGLRRCGGLGRRYGCGFGRGLRRRLGRRDRFRRGGLGQLGGLGRGGQGLDELLARALGVGVDEVDDALDVFRDRRGFEVEELGPGHADVGDGLVDLEELESVLGELLAELGGDGEREMALLLPFLADQALQAGAAQAAAGQAGDQEGFHGLDDAVLVGGAEMLLHLFQRGQLEWLWHIQAAVVGLEALLLDPFLHHGLVLDDFHPGFEGVERHARKLFRVQFAELVLVVVIVGRAENDAAHAALGHEGVNALGRIGLRALGLIKGAEMVFEDVVHGLGLAGPRGIVQRANKQGLGRGRPFFLGELHGIALGLLQNQEGDFEKRVGAAGDLDLAGQQLDAAFLGDEGDTQFGQRGERLGILAGLVAPIVPAGAAAAVAKFTVGPGGSSCSGTGARAAATITAAAGAGAPAFAGLVVEAALGFDALVAGEFFKTIGLGFPLRPGGLKEVFQVKIQICDVAHIKKAPTRGVEFRA